MKGGNYILIFVMIIFMVSLMSAQTSNTLDRLGPFKTSTDIDIKQICGNSTATCSSCNISSVVIPNSTNIIEDVIMTKRGGDFNYTLNSSLTTTTGDYVINGLCISGTQIVVWSYLIEVNPTGFRQDTANAIVNLFLALGVFSVFLLSLFFNLTISSKNPTDEQGQIVQITRTKYLKFMLILITYPLGLWFINILVGIANSYPSLNLYSGFFEFLLEGILIRLAFPLFIFVFVVIVFNIIRDSNIKDMAKNLGRALK